MSEVLRWWLMTVVVGFAALPMCLTLFRRLPDRGYSLSKPFALLLVSYVFWILVHLGFANSTRVIWFVLLLFFAASAYMVWRSRAEMLAFVRERWWLIGATEAVFFLAFVTAAYLRSFVPDLGGTEKPMDFMFLNALFHAESFPPADLWLAGESVSYYYFGYLIVAIMTKLSGLAPSVGFNLGLAMIVGLTITAAFGLVYNLAAPREERAIASGPGTPAAGFSKRILWRPMVFGLVGALLLTIMGHLEGLLEAFAAHGFGSNGFWSWIGINDLVKSESARWFPDQFWFWWRATRVIEVVPGTFGIHEFPFFSFLLGDLHPHVMSIPFVLLAIGVAFALLRSDGPLDVVVWLERPFTLVAFGLILGGLAFLNTWDMPTMAFIIVLVTLIRNRLQAQRWSWSLVLDSAGFLVPLFIVAFLAYIPFIFGGFSSQASGFSAAAGAGTRLLHTFLLWGVFAVIVLPYAIWRLAKSAQPLTRQAVLWSTTPFLAVLALWLSWDALHFVSSAGGIIPDAFGLNEIARNSDGETIQVWTRIGNRGWTWLSTLAIGGALSLLSLALVREIDAARRSAEENLSHIMALALSATAALLILGAELIFIQDQFNSRMNTVFKLYYQAWLFLSIAGAFVLYELAGSLKLPSLARPRAAPASDSASTSEPASTSEHPWALGEYGVMLATLIGAITGLFVLGVQMTSSLFTQIIGAGIGAGLFFVASGAAVLIARTLAPTNPGSASKTSLSWRAVWAGGAIVIVAAAFIYPLTATWNRTEGCVGRPLRLLDGSDACAQIYANRTLDGLARIDPEEREAIEWLLDLQGQPVIAEALGGDYTEGGRVSASTGLPSPLQWPGHEAQWRGTYVPQDGRPEDLEVLYTSSDTAQLREIIEKYSIAYVYLGQREREQYSNVALPVELFEPAFERSMVTIYRVRQEFLGEAARE